VSSMGRLSSEQASQGTQRAVEHAGGATRVRSVRGSRDASPDMRPPAAPTLSRASVQAQVDEIQQRLGLFVRPPPSAPL
jgi:hypothetical protein